MTESATNAIAETLARAYPMISEWLARPDVKAEFERWKEEREKRGVQ